MAPAEMPASCLEAVLGAAEVVAEAAALLALDTEDTVPGGDVAVVVNELPTIEEAKEELGGVRRLESA
ncbi:hypothetical protein FRC09_014860 [Ceratobasidium sp. 395]|nr:hypothetical protein FRC09_014860 [Ceratobasidium sp. 395]